MSKIIQWAAVFHKSERWRCQQGRKVTRMGILISNKFNRDSVCSQCNKLCNGSNAPFDHQRIPTSWGTAPVVLFSPLYGMDCFLSWIITYCIDLIIQRLARRRLVTDKELFDAFLLVASHCALRAAAAGAASPKLFAGLTTIALWRLPAWCWLQQRPRKPRRRRRLLSLSDISHDASRDSLNSKFKLGFDGSYWVNLRLWSPI